MADLLKQIKFHIVNIFTFDGRLSIKFITKKNLPFFVGWIAVFSWLYVFLLPIGSFRIEKEIFGLPVVNILMFTWLIVAPTITVFGDGKKYVQYTFYSSIVAAISFICIFLIGNEAISLIYLFIVAICIGHIFASTCYAFFMFLNNSEKFYAMILGIVIPMLFTLVKPLYMDMHTNFDLGYILQYLTLGVILICTCFYKQGVLEFPESSKIKAPKNAYSLMVLVFIVLALNDIVAPTMIQQITDFSKININIFYILGAFIGIITILLLQQVLKFNICNMINISFLFLSLGFVTNIISTEFREIIPVSVVFFGISYSIGLVNIYYMAGVMAKKFQSVTFYRVGIVLSSVYYFSAFFVVGSFSDIEAKTSSIIIAILSILILLIFFALSPFFVRVLYSGEWNDDIYRYDVTYDDRLTAKLKEYKLSPKEIQVCFYLLQGYTMRQISAMMEIAYPTVNTYCTSIYRKLGINSKTELIVDLGQYIKK